MSDVPNLKNITNIDGGSKSAYLIKGTDDVINVNTSLGELDLLLPNIKSGDLQLFYKTI